MAVQDEIRRMETELAKATKKRNKLLRKGRKGDAETIAQRMRLIRFRLDNTHNFSR